MPSGAGNPLSIKLASAELFPLCELMRSQCAFALSPHVPALIGTERKVVVLMP